MNTTRGRCAVILAICVGLPVVTVHLVTQARALTTLIRTSIAMGGAFAIGLGLEWALRRVVSGTPSANGQAANGRHLDLVVGAPATEQEQLRDLLAGESASDRTS